MSQHSLNSFLSMKHTLLAALVGIVSLLVVSCGGGGSSSSDSGTNKDGGFAPETLTSDILLCPTDYDAGGRIWLTVTPARTAYFNSERDANGNYVNGANGSFLQGRYTYLGNYTYTKCGPNMAELKVVNLRAEAADSAHDCHWTVIGHLTFVDKKNVIFTGTETLVDTEAHIDKGDGTMGNDPMGFGGADSGVDENGDGVVNEADGAHNHFPGVLHDGGGTRNFSLNYTFTTK